MRLTKYELELFLGYLKSLRMYRGCKPALGAKVWDEEWMGRSIEKLENELFISYGTTHNWK